MGGWGLDVSERESEKKSRDKREGEKRQRRDGDERGLGARASFFCVTCPSTQKNERRQSRAIGTEVMPIVK